MCLFISNHTEKIHLKIPKIINLHPKFYDPYQVWKRFEEVACAIDIPNKGKLCYVFHVPCLKKKLGPTNLIQTELHVLDDEGKLVLEPECILEVKTRTLCSKSFNEYLVKWKNLPDDESTWENEDLCSQHLSLPILCG